MIITVPLGLTDFQSVICCMNVCKKTLFQVFRCAIFMMFLLLVFNKTPVIIQRLSPSFFCKKRVTFQKTRVFQLSIFASSFYSVFVLFSYMFWGVLEKHMFHASVGPLGLSLRPNLATARAREGQSPRCFPC